MKTTTNDSPYSGGHHSRKQNSFFRMIPSGDLPSESAGSDMDSRGGFSVSALDFLRADM